MKAIIIQIILCLIFSSGFIEHAAAKNLMDQSGNVFKFHQKLAKKGDKLSQFKIGYMYEMGEGIAPDLRKAKEWYLQSAKKGYVSAKLRLNYIKIKRIGYVPASHKPWLKKVKDAAFSKNPQGLFLLGQLYHQGLGVEKDLDKALNIMYELGTEGLKAVDKEIILIKNEMGASNNKSKKSAKKSVKKTRKSKARNKRKIKKSKKKKLTKKEQKAEKRKRYEAVMQKLAEEQEEINKIQGWSEGDKKDDLNADDEI